MLHSALKDAIDREFAGGVVKSAALCRDALLVSLHNQVTIELRFADAREYSIGWRWGDAELRIDTAPLHGELATFPNHLHDSAARLRADPLTDPGRQPWDNVRAVIAALAIDPLLGNEAAAASGEGAAGGDTDRLERLPSAGTVVGAAS